MMLTEEINSIILQVNKLMFNLDFYNQTKFLPISVNSQVPYYTFNYFKQIPLFTKYFKLQGTNFTLNLRLSTCK